MFVQNGDTLHLCWQVADTVVFGNLRQPQIARGSLLWEQIYPQEPDGRPVASPTGAALPGMHVYEQHPHYAMAAPGRRAKLIFVRLKYYGTKKIRMPACGALVLSLGMLFADVPCANMPLLWWAATSMCGILQLAAAPKQ